MNQFLVIEDEKPLLKAIARRIEREFPDATVSTAGTIVEALDHISAMHEQQASYDVIIEDFLVPLDETSSPDVHDDVRRSVCENMPDALVVYMTAFRGDPRVEAQVLKHRNEDPRNAKPAVVEKQIEVDWTDDLVTLIKRYVHSSRIARRLDGLIGPADVRPGDQRWRHSRVGETNLTHELILLSLDIENHWDFLESHLQERIRVAFDVIEDGAKLRVIL